MNLLSPELQNNTTSRFTKWVGSTASLIVHTALFVIAFFLGMFVFAWNDVLLVLTTAVSLEAIYLAIFIQMTVNRNTESLKEVEEDVDEIQEDIGEIQKDVDEIQEDVGEIQEDVLEQTEEPARLSEEGIRTILERIQDDVNRLAKEAGRKDV